MIDEISVNWKRNRLRDDEEGQRLLHRIESRVKSFGDVCGEEGPGVLQIGDGQHRQDAGNEDRPAPSAGIIA